MAGWAKSAPRSASAGRVRTSRAMTSWPCASSRASRWRRSRAVREVAEGLPEMERTVAMTGPFGLEFGTRNTGTVKGGNAGTRKRQGTEIRNSRMPKTYRIHGAVQCGGEPCGNRSARWRSDGACRRGGGLVAGALGTRQRARQQEELETRARSTWRRRVRSSPVFMPPIQPGRVGPVKKSPCRSRIAEQPSPRAGINREGRVPFGNPSGSAAYRRMPAPSCAAPRPGAG